MSLGGGGGGGNDFSPHMHSADGCYFVPLRPMQQITNNLPLFMHFIRSPNNWTIFLQAVDFSSLMSFTTTTSSELITPGAAPATRLLAEAVVCLDANLDIRPLGTVGGRFLLLGDLGRGGCLWEEPKGRESIYSNDYNEQY